MLYRASGSGCSEYYHLRDLNQERIVRRPTAYPAELHGHPLASYYYAYKVYYDMCIYYMLLLLYVCSTVYIFMYTYSYYVFFMY